MPKGPDSMRRWFGLLFLALAFGMLIWGQTVLRERLESIPWLFLVYWCFCFIFTFGAIVTALLDMRETRKKARAEQKELLGRTLDDIDEESRRKKDDVKH